MNCTGRQEAHQGYGSVCELCARLRDWPMQDGAHSTDRSYGAIICAVCHAQSWDQMDGVVRVVLAAFYRSRKRASSLAFLIGKSLLLSFVGQKQQRLLQCTLHSLRTLQVMVRPSLTIRSIFLLRRTHGTAIRRRLKMWTHGRVRLTVISLHVCAFGICLKSAIR